MLTPTSLAVIAVTILGSSLLSGIFGMAGGLIMLGVLLAYFDVAPAMVLFGAIQLTANGWRLVLWYRYVQWRIVWRYFIGGLAVFLALRSVAFLPSKAVVYLFLGLMPFAVEMLPKSLALDITRSGRPYLCGAVVILLQLFAGAAGHILDLFFQRSPLDRREIVATKAVAQVGGHALRIVYFGSFAGAFDTGVPWYAFIGVVALSMAGTTLASLVLERMTDAGFRLWSRRVVFTIAIVFLVRAVHMLATAAPG